MECPVAREVIEKLIDDLDGGDAAETVTFGLDGTTYGIDLSKKNAAVFRNSLARYVNAARRSTAPSRSARRTAPSRSARRTAPSRSTRRPAAPSTNGSKPKRDFDILQLREWAGANKVAVPARGRIPNSVVEQYKQAGGR
jgi:hypothetical protein